MENLTGDIFILLILMQIYIYISINCVFEVRISEMRKFYGGKVVV